MDKQRIIWLITILLLSLLGYVWIGYGTVRADFGQLIILYAFLCGFYLFALYRKIFEVKFSILLGAALLLRISLLFMTPNLTDDYFRYIWDGLLSTHGYNPYLILPSEFIQSSQSVHGITTTLYDQLNSPSYYTVYPPVCQFLFYLSAKLAGGNVLGNIVILRVIVLLAEFGSIVFLYKVTSKLSVSPNLVAIYAFNPLVIIELTGNLHLEAVMLFFLVLAMYLLAQKKHLYAAAGFGLAIGVKLVPLIFLPLFIKRLGLTKSMIFYAIVGGTFTVLFVPFFSTNLAANLLSSVSLYFQKFEFNASIYYLLRWIGYQVMGYNTIAILGIVLAISVFIIIVVIAIKEKGTNWQSFFQSALMCLTVYFLLTTTVHPWYITSLLLVSVFTRYRYAVLWSILIILSYAAYQTRPYTENLWLVATEYIVVVGWLVYEWRKKTAAKNYI